MKLRASALKKLCGWPRRIPWSTFAWPRACKECNAWTPRDSTIENILSLNLKDGLRVMPRRPSRKSTTSWASRTQPRAAPPRHAKRASGTPAAGPHNFCCSVMLFLAEEGSAAGVHQDREMGRGLAGAIDHVPAQLACHGVKVQQIPDCLFGVLFHELLAAVLLRYFISLIRVHFEEVQIKGTHGPVGRVVGVFRSMVHASRRIRAGHAGPGKRLRFPASRRSKGGPPEPGFAVAAIGVLQNF